MPVWPTMLGGKGRSRRSDSRARLSRASPSVPASSPMARSSARFVSAETRCRRPEAANHSGAMPTASASVSITSSEEGRLAGRGAAPSHSASSTTERGSTAASPVSSGSVGAASLAVSSTRRQCQPGRGSGKATARLSVPAWNTTSTRSAGAPASRPGAARRPISVDVAGRSQSPASGGRPSGRRQATSGRPLPGTGAPVRKLSCVSAGWAARSSTRRRVKPSMGWSGRDQSSQAVALSCE